MSFPNFLIAGGVATGTSFLSSVLSTHPEIYLPRIQRPEPNFFHYSWKFNRGLEWYQNSWFHEVSNQIAIGERSSLMLPSEIAAERLKNTFPDIKLIFCIRNPIERAWGNYRFTVLEGLEPLEFDEAIKLEGERIKSAVGFWSEVQPHAYVMRSKYSNSLQKYIELFGRNQILLIKSEDLGRNPHQNINKVCRFLGVNASLQLPLPMNYSSPSVIDRHLQIELRNYFGDRFPDLVERIRREEDISLIGTSNDENSKLGLLRNNLSNSKSPMPDTSRQLLSTLLSEEISTLSNMVDFPVDDWN